MLNASAFDYAGFGSTYEGLKRSDGVPLSTSLESFGSTYEGLKLGSGYSIFRILPRFRQYL